MVNSILDEVGDAIHFLRDPTRGGVATVLNEIVGQRQVGINVRQTMLPIDEQVDGACELLGLDPLYVANEGIFIAFVEERAADQVVSILSKQEGGMNASVIGEVVQDHVGKVVLSSRIGGRRVVNYLTGEQLPRIC